MKGFLRVFFPVAVLAVLVQPAEGQHADREIIAENPVLSLSRAGRLAIGPAGRIFVTDRDRNVLLVLSSDGKLEQRIGGPGIEEGRFDDPADVDPGVGLVISVADSRNGRIQRFSKDFRFLESLPVQAETDDDFESDDPGFRVGTNGVTPLPSGRPIAVTSSVTDDLYVIDALSRTVIRWDRDRRQRWTIGGSLAGDGALIEPVDLTTTSNFLFVADAGCECLVVYDLFGTFVRIIAAGRLPGIRAVDRLPSGIMLLSGNRIIEYSSDGVRTRTIDLRLPGPPIDAAFRDGRYVLLTEEGLFIVPE